MSHLIGTQKKACFLENDWKVSEKLWQINWDLRYKCSKYIEWQKGKKSILHRKKKSFEKKSNRKNLKKTSWLDCLMHKTGRREVMMVS